MSVEERLERLESSEEIQQLRANYCYHIDHTNPDEFTSLFVEDGTIDFGSAGTYTGHDELHEFVADIVPDYYSFIVHMLHNPIIDVDGDTASGRWYFEAPATSEGTDMWIQGEYTDSYVREDGEWLFESVDTRFNYVAEYDDGWGED